MTASDRFAAYLRGEKVDRVPAIEWAPWWNQTVARWSGEGIPPEITASVDKLQGYFGLDRCLQIGFTPRTGATPSEKSFGSGIMETEEDYEEIRKTLFPDAGSIYSDETYAEWNRDRERGDTLRFLSVEGAFWYPRKLFGIENHLYSFYDYPELYHRICDEYADWLEKVLPYIFSRFRFDFITFAEDMSYNSGPMLSQRHFEEFLAPFYRRIIPVVHSFGIPVIVDSDGDITDAVDWYASVGVDGMLPLERKAGVDVSTYIKKQPQMCFIGHFDKMCMKDGPDAMRAEFERILPSVLRGKVIPSVDHQTPPDVSADLYREYVKLLFEYAGKGTHAEGNFLPCPVYQK